MEKGYLAAHGMKWTKGGVNVNLVKLGSVGYGKTVDSYRCPKCGKIELYSEVK